MSAAISSGPQVGAITATNANGQTVTVLVDLATVLTTTANGTVGNATVDNSGTVTVGGTTTTTPTTPFNPCTNVIADYC